MKRNPAIAIIMCLLVSFTFSACAPAAPSGQTPEFFHDIGKTLSELKKEHPEGELIVRLDGSPDSAAICFGDPEAEYLYYFFGTQSGDAEKAMKWLNNGAQPSDTVRNILSRQGIMKQFHEEKLARKKK